MSKIKNIIKGWKNLFIEDKELMPLFQSRFDICKKCKYNKLQTCLKCGCFIPAKVRSPEENCPENFWHPIIYIDNYYQYILKSELPDNLQSYFTDEEIDLKQWQEFLKEIENEQKRKISK